MRPKQHATTGSGDLFRAKLEQIINMKHELVALAGKIDWAWIDGEIAPLYSDQGRPGVETRFVIGLLLLKHIYGLSDEGVCERWVHDAYFQVCGVLSLRHFGLARSCSLSLGGWWAEESGAAHLDLLGPPGRRCGCWPHDGEVAGGDSFFVISGSGRWRW